MFKIISVTNRHLCEEPILDRIRKIAEAGVDAIILREKDLPEEKYLALAKEALTICRSTGTLCILHRFYDAAQRLEAENLHLPLPVLRDLSPEQRQSFVFLGASCHSLKDVQEAEALGCSYVTLGHIFATDCKKGLPPRGLGLLEAVCRESSLPVFAIGGIGEENLREVQAAGASGACIMSGLMTCQNPEDTIKRFRKSLDHRP